MVWAREGAAEVDVVKEMVRGRPFVYRCCVGRMEEGVG
jgi:hypothetical protein